MRTNLSIATIEQHLVPTDPGQLSGSSVWELIKERDPEKAIHSGRTMARAWSKDLPEGDHLHWTRTFIKQVIAAYWESAYQSVSHRVSLPSVYSPIQLKPLDSSASAVAKAIGRAAGGLNVIEAAYALGNLYTSMLPEKLRSSNGVYYTPPSLSKRLIEMSTTAGVKWDQASVADPACGGGAFLVPIVQKIAASISQKAPLDQLEHVESHIKGFEIDPFAAWLAQVFLEVALRDVATKANRRLKKLVAVCDTLELDFRESEKFDLVIGNPPYGKVKLSEQLKARFKSSLYGHPNLYGLFTHKALTMVKKDGVISFLTPTSFLSGEYFKNLRALLRCQTSVVEIDFIAVRKGVFEDVLQETMLATYQHGGTKHDLPLVNETVTSRNGAAERIEIAKCALPQEPTAPWILPKKAEQRSSVDAMSAMSARLADWGYKVSTGPLVWNRHKAQLSDKASKRSLPIIWSEAVTQDGRFSLKAEKKNHSAWFHFKSGDEFLMTTKSCVLLQRTTAKEQEKRLIAAVLPVSLLKKCNAVIVENHLNMILPIRPKPAVCLDVLSAFLNSKAVNNAFRTISGSVAVSAYELESLPLPNASELDHLKQLVRGNSSKEEIEGECLHLYTVRNK